ncbi:O-antigen ligase family protein, partial [bacterium]|nr:O-antigen ligase family protein [bacterium]
NKNLLCIPSTVYQYPTILKILDILSLAIIFWVIINNFTKKSQINRLLTVIIFMGFSLSFLCILQHLSKGGNTFLGIKPMYARSKFFGPYINGNHFAAYLGMIVPLSIGMGLSEIKKSKKLLFWFLGIIMALGLLFSLSNGGIVSFIGAMIFLFIFLNSRKSTQKGKWIIATVLCLVIMGVIWLGINPIKEEASQLFQFNQSESFQSRWPVWKASIKMLKGNWLFGTGLGTFRYVFPKFRPPGINREFRYVHNDYLAVLLNTGIVGFLILFLGGFYYFRNIIKEFYKRRNPYIIAISCGIITALFSMLLHSFVDFNLQIGPNALLFIIITALTIQILKLRNENKDSSPLEGEGRVRGNNLRIYDIPLGWKKSLAGGIAGIISLILIVILIKPARANYYYNGYLSNKNIENLEKAINLNPLNALYHYKLFLEYLKKKPQNKYIKNSLKEIKQAIYLNPTNAKYHLTLAVLYSQLANRPIIHRPSEDDYIKLAHQEFQQAIYLAPNSPYGHKIYADWLFVNPKNIEKGISEYKKALTLKPELTADTLESCYNSTHNYNLLSKIIPDTIDAHFALRKYLLKKGLKEKALGEEKIVLDKITSEISLAKDKKEIYQKAGQIYHDLGKFNESINAYKKAIESGLQSTWNYYNLANSYRKLGRIDLAIKYFKLSAKLDKNNSWPYFSLAKLYQRLGEEEESKLMWEKILKLRKPDPDVKRIAKRELNKY